MALSLHLLCRIYPSGMKNEEICSYRQKYTTQFQKCTILIADNGELSKREDDKNTCSHPQPIKSTYSQ